MPGAAVDQPPAAPGARRGPARVGQLRSGNVKARDGVGESGAAISQV